VDYESIEEVEPVCPICGEQCEVVFFDRKTEEPVGCDVCLDWEYSLEWNEKQFVDKEAIKGDMEYDARKERGW